MKLVFRLGECGFSDSGLLVLLEGLEWKLSVTSDSKEIIIMWFGDEYLMENWLIFGNEPRKTKEFFDNSLAL